MSNEPRFGARIRKAAEPDLPAFDDYDADPKSAWAAKLDAFAPTAKVVAAAQAAPPAPVAEPIVFTSTVAAPAPVAAPKPSGPRLEDNLEELIDFEGAMAVALVDSETGMILGRAGEGVNLDLAAAGASTMLRARQSTIKMLDLPDSIDDLLVTLTTQLQIIRPLAQSPTLFLYLVVDRAKSSLAMARFKSSDAASKIVL
jgi:hypothetical protein